MRRVLLLAAALTLLATSACAAADTYYSHIDAAREYEACGLLENALAEYRAASRTELGGSSYAGDQIVRLEYVTLRNRLQLQAAPTAARLSAEPARWSGAFFEYRGTVERIDDARGHCSIFVGGASMEFVALRSRCLGPGKAVVFIVRMPYGPGNALPEIMAVAPADLLPEPSQEANTATGGPYPVVFETYVAPTPAPSNTTPDAPRRTSEHARRVAVSASAVRSTVSSSPAAPSREKAVASDALVKAYASAARFFNPRLKQATADLIAGAVLRYSLRNEVDPRLIMAVIAAESNFRPTATSSAGAAGLGQLMPATAAGLGIRDRYDPEQSIMGAVKILKGHLDKWEGEDRGLQHALALASYNAGPGAVRKYGGVPPYRETRTYIDRVLSLYKAFCGQR